MVSGCRRSGNASRRTGPVRKCAADPRLRDGGRRRARLGRSALFCAAQAGTLAGAARAMGVEHSTIGRRLSALERTLGAPGGACPDGLHLTPLGESLLPLAEGVERSVLHGRASQRPRASAGDAHRFHRVVLRRTGALRDAHRLTLELLTGSRPVDLLRARPTGDPQRAGRRCADRAPARRVGLLVVCGAVLSVAPSETRRPRRPVEHDVIGFDPALADTPPASWLAAHAAGHDRVAQPQLADMQAAHWPVRGGPAAMPERRRRSRSAPRRRRCWCGACCGWSIRASRACRTGAGGDPLRARRHARARGARARPRP